MGSENFKRDNHYVPRSYLKRWASPEGKLWSYRMLVSRPEVPPWKQVSTRGVAYHEHLYTRIASSGDSDDLERWLEAKFETPANEVIEKVVSDRRLTPTDWRCLARFFAAQDVRTPARFVENFERWSVSLPQVIQDTLNQSLAHLETMSPKERASQTNNVTQDDRIPFRVSVEAKPDGDGGWVKGETVAGRNLWVWSIRQILSGSRSLRALEGHHWTILTPPDGITWFTSDDPVLKLNFNSQEDYNFGGGWGSIGTDLMLPLGPRHLLFTQVGKRVPPRGSQMDKEKAQLVRKLMAEHAHRHIFANTPDLFVEQTRPRVVNASAFSSESAQWKTWHSQQSQAEHEFLGLVETESPTTKNAP